MTANRPQRPQPPNKSNRPSDGDSLPELAPKPYEFVSFPKEKPNLQHPAGHHQYLSDRLHGALYLTLKVQTSLHVSTGVVVMGSDIGNNRIPLIKTMIQGVDQKLSIQGSSLKGCIRSVYEAITKSCVCKTKADFRTIPDGYNRVCKVDVRKDSNLVCDACRIFGALNLQGLLDFNDASCLNLGFSNGFMPPLHRPRPDKRDQYFINGKVAGRKFYYNMSKAIDKGQREGIPVQQAGREYIFKTKLNFKNLLPEELGTLLIVLGQDSKCPIALKVGGGKPIGMGTMTVIVNRIARTQSLQQRYSDYKINDSDELIGDALQQFMQTQIQAAYSRLIQQPQLDQLTAVLRYPTDREPPSGMY
ncbi:CRISPR-associated protein [Komarekiella sp. 'clone 1']|uniref:CRISPR-associated protein n=1 Tax=Komarekiella delphini-convector SJRDD-AB1 TaxID=2593771 RepID=A0AA40VPU2_9NOST|nr:RAMP superfamily CRISPR-associated protein [Komarekiella delphini-convector]MBD6615644.1 CRISPR-associated protein [Komarekiella delphini-convector SJRDD-AB1]